MKRFVLGLFATVLLMAQMATAMAEQVQVTVYNDNRALVNEQRTLKLRKGLNEIRFTDVSARIDPTSVSFSSLTDPKGTVVLEQNFEYDLISTEKLLQKYLDEQVQAVTKDGTKYCGILLGTAGGLIIQAKDGSTVIVSRDQVREIQFPFLPEGLITKPTLMWLLQARKAGMHNVEVAYITGGMGWHADYVLSLSPDDKTADLDGWVTVDNKTGMTFRRARLKLVAGELHKIPKPQRKQVLTKAMVAEAATEVKGRAMFEYHLYEVQRPVDIKNNQTKQIEFITSKGIPVEKRFVLDSRHSFRYFGPSTQKGKVDVQIRFRNAESSGLGMPFPAGRVRLYKADVDGTRQLIGEDKIGHTPKNEEIVLTVGVAFDIVGQRKKLASKVLGKRAREETWEIEVINHKKKTVTVHVIEALSAWGEWEIVSETVEHKKLDAGTIEYLLSIGPESKKSVRYTVIYRW
ncbi:MAG: DUF4139 domain-containing protein [Deltaproteobacteria bacterium]|nr:MAG: DUF4139 domain-containing protein [Deltaproteobacteria bacterium]